MRYRKKKTIIIIEIMIKFTSKWLLTDCYIVKKTGTLQ